MIRIKGVTEMHALFRGRVQGVFFRANAREKAELLGLPGWVQNLPDGSVELVAQGDKEELEALLQKLQEDPGQGRIDHIDYSFRKAKESLEEFAIRW